MHILILASFYPSEVRPHTGIFFQDQARALQKAGHQVTVLVLPRIRESLHILRYQRALPPITLEGDDDLPVYRMHYGWFPRVFPSTCASLVKHFGMKAFEQVYNDRGKPAVVHAHNIFYAGYLAVCIQKQYGSPTVLTEHSSNHLRGRMFLSGQHRIIRETLKYIAHPLAVGTSLVNHLNTYQPQTPVRLIDNMVNLRHFDLSPMPNRSPFAFASVGNMDANKNFSLLIRAFAQRFRAKDAKLIIGGSGPMHKKLHSLINELGLSDQVELAGRLTRDQVRKLFKKSHAIVSSSNVETFGITLIEAMACGRPVIATASGGPQGFVNEINGILVPVNDVDEMAQAMWHMYENYSMYEPAKIRAFCENRFAEEVIVSRLQTIYESL